MKYRVLVTTDRSGNQKYYPQKKCLLIFWRYMYQRTSWTRIDFDTLGEAAECIHYHKSAIFHKRQKKIVKTKVVLHA